MKYVLAIVSVSLLLAGQAAAAPPIAHPDPSMLPEFLPPLPPMEEEDTTGLPFPLPPFVAGPPDESQSLQYAPDEYQDEYEGE